MPEKESIKRENENWLAAHTYRKIGNPLAVWLSNFKITSIHVSVASIISSIIAGIFFSFGKFEYLLIGYLFFQIAILLDHVDGAIARYTKKQSILGSWFDRFSNKMHRFFFVFGISMGAYKTTNDPLVLMLGIVAIFLWFFSLYISETRRNMFKFKEDVTLFKESKRKYAFPFNLLAMNIFGFLVLISQTIALWFIILVSLNAFQQIYSVARQWRKENGASKK
ncbi:MAG: CDP-alcohol phosphatidyltransferase family protein [Nanoarchaeota archaeon]